VVVEGRHDLVEVVVLILGLLEVAVVLFFLEVVGVWILDRPEVEGLFE
jgi:hypothetical protein